MTKLPVFKTLIDSYKDTYRSPFRFLRVSLVWIVLFAILHYVFHERFVDYMDVRFLMSYGFDSVRTDEVIRMVCIYLGLAFFLQYAFSGAFVGSYVTDRSRWFIFGRSELEYLLKNVLLTVLPAVAIFFIVKGLLYVAFKTIPQEWFMYAVENYDLQIIAYCIIIVILLTYLFTYLRFSMILPSSFAEKRISLVKSWKLMRGNTFRLFLVIMGTALPIAILLSISSYFAFDLLAYKHAWFYVVYSCSYLLFAPITCVSLAKTYRHFAAQ